MQSARFTRTLGNLETSRCLFVAIASPVSTEAATAKRAILAGESVTRLRKRAARLEGPAGLDRHRLPGTTQGGVPTLVRRGRSSSSSRALDSPCARGRLQKQPPCTRSIMLLVQPSIARGDGGTASLPRNGGKTPAPSATCCRPLLSANG
jgi:hypothetical protein